MENLLEEVITVMIYFMLVTLVIKLVWESYPLAFMGKLFTPQDEEK